MDSDMKLAIDGGTPVSQTAVPFMAPVVNDDDVEAAITVLRSGMLRQAKRSDELEQRLSLVSDARHGFTCANGTCALQLAYGATIEAGDEVIVPAWTYIATASMIAAAGATPVFCDVRRDTFNIDIDDAERRITPRTRAIACTHLYGNPVDIDGVQYLAEKHGLRVIYDAAQAHLARYKGTGIGAFGDVATYSFYATKNMATGEGGFVSCNDDQIAHKIRMLRSHGESDKYLHESIGFNYRMTDVEAAIGCSQLDRLPDLNVRRRAAAARLDKILESIDGVEAPTITEGAEPVYHLYTCKLDTDAFDCDRDRFIDALRAEGVQVAVHYPRSLTDQPAFNRWVTDRPPVSSQLASCVFSLPVHPKLTDEHLDIIEKALTKVTRAYRKPDVVVRATAAGVRN